MRFQRKLSMPRTWPVARKINNTYITSVLGKNMEESIPLVILMRDILKIAETKKEVKKILKNKEVVVDGKIREDERYPVGLLDIISLPKLNKYYKIIMEGKKLKASEISEKESHEKNFKVLGKKQISKKKVQINLYGGKNVIYEGKISVNDSVIIDLKQNKIIKTIPFIENSKAFIFFGKHAGKQGEIKKIIKEGKIQECLLKIGKEEIKIPTRNVFIAE